MTTSRLCGAHYRTSPSLESLRRYCKSIRTTRSRVKQILCLLFEEFYTCISSIFCYIGMQFLKYLHFSPIFLMCRARSVCIWLPSYKPGIRVITKNANGI
ncbi:hypothetical protein KC19_VG243200 [Ceratodon purpureus]|uniref:Uncharacterized protein n=1 Tax=Ceratodon purpureus TaxID=3225 RepID=A0A8T0HT34_CERPU|nr:hypothetical protein KC19_VG243200 [Ceratodon purpureus]